MARMTNFRSAAIATGNSITDSAYDNVKVVADNIGSVNVVGALATEDGVDFALLADVLNNLGETTSEHLASLAGLDLSELVDDLAKGNYLGNRKIDINLSLNVQGMTTELIKNAPQEAEALWVANSSNIAYDSATITFVDGVIIELPFLSDNNPTVITNSDGLLVQLSRTDVVDAVAQENVIYSFDVLDSTTYMVEIDNIDYTYTTGTGATRGEIVTGLTNQINSGVQPWTAYSETDNIRIKADVAGNGFTASVDTNMLIRTDVESVTAGNYPTAFLTKLEDTSFNSFTLDTVSNTVRLFDVIGANSNIERVQLHTSISASGYIENSPIYYWAKTTSALESLSMRAGDIIKLGNEIDNIVLLASSIEQVLEIQDRIPEFIDSYVDGVPQGDVTIHNKLAELDAIYQELVGIITVYEDIKAGGTNYINDLATDLQLGDSSKVSTVSTDLQLGVDSKIKLVADDIVAVRDASENATIATQQAELATTKADEIKVVSVGSTVTAVAGTSASVQYTPATGQFTFVVPQGAKGDRGDAFTVDTIGLFADLSDYGSQPTGYAYLSTDTGELYFKLSATVDDWSDPIPFGKGDTGVGISSIAKTGTVGVVDTYTITYSDLSTYSFEVSNGDISGLSASDIPVDASGFVGSLSPADDTVAKALATIDGIISALPPVPISLGGATTSQETNVTTVSTVLITDTLYDPLVTYVAEVDFGSVVDNNDGTYLVTIPGFTTSNNVKFTLGATKAGTSDGQAIHNIAVVNTTLATPVFTGSPITGVESSVVRITLDNLDPTVTYTDAALNFGSFVLISQGVYDITLPDYAIATSVTFSLKATRLDDIDSAVGTHSIAVTNTVLVTPVLEFASAVNEGVASTITISAGTYDPSYTYIFGTTGEIGTLTYVSGNTATLGAYNILDDVDHVGTITCYATKAGDVTSSTASQSITIKYVLPITADTAYQVVDFTGQASFNDGFDLI